MKIIISETQLRNIINEYRILDYKKAIESPETTSHKFNVDNLKYEVSIFHDSSKHEVGEYEIEFHVYGQKHNGERTKKDMNHLFNVIYTVIEIAEKVAKERKIRKLKFEGAEDEKDASSVFGSTIRAKLYQRIVNRRYPSEAIISSGRFTKIDMTKVFPELFTKERQTNMGKLIDLLVSISNRSEDENEVKSDIRRGANGPDENNQFTINTDAIVNNEYGTIYIEIFVNKPMKEYNVDITLYDQDDEQISESFGSFEELYNFIKDKF